MKYVNIMILVMVSNLAFAKGGAHVAVHVTPFHSAKQAPAKPAKIKILKAH